MLFKGFTITDSFDKFIGFTKKHNVVWGEFDKIEFDNEFTNRWLNKDEEPNPIIKKDLITLGQADGTGGRFAFWNNGDNNSIDKMPVVILGSEGELALIAKDLFAFFRLLTLKDEIYTQMQGSLHPLNAVAYCSEDEDDEYDISNPEFKLFIKKNFDLNSLGSPQEGDAIIAEARDLYQNSLTTWYKAAFPNDIKKATAVVPSDALIILYDHSYGKSIENLIEQKSDDLCKPIIFFLRWLILNDCLRIGTDADIEKLRIGEMNILDFLRKYDSKGYFVKDDLVNHQEFIGNYFSRKRGFFNPDDAPNYIHDFDISFITDIDLKNYIRRGHLSIHAKKVISSIPYNDVSFEVVDYFIQKRIQEYREHQFSKSNTLLNKQ